MYSTMIMSKPILGSLLLCVPVTSMSCTFFFLVYTPDPCIFVLRGIKPKQKQQMTEKGEREGGGKQQNYQRYFIIFEEVPESTSY
uniref:Uncharacterized protein n=1 Tax=Oryza brachyantha TaxID=4533 RepID=J3MAE4_ORYBR